MTARHTIRFRLLVAINSAMAALLVLFLVFDYHRQMDDRVAEKHVAMVEEARTLLHAVLRLRSRQVAAVQEYIDAVCGHMQESHSPGHHITLAYNGVVIQSRAHGRNSPDMLQAVQAGAISPRHRAHLNGETLVVGSARQDGVTVYVAEYLTNVLSSVRGQVWLGIGRIIVLALAMEAIVNLVLLRMVAQPLEKLKATVDEIAQGRLGVQTEAFKSVEMISLATAINSMSSSLAATDRERRYQMAKACRIQEHLLPHDTDVPGLRIAHFYQPATDIAGDYYDLVALPDGTWLLCVADVSGHGVPAAMGAAMLKTLLLHASERSSEVHEILSFINRRFAAVSLVGDFATMFLARWQPATSSFQYASAGHGLVWFLSAAGVLRDLPPSGLPLAVDEEGEWQAATIRVGKGDRLLLVSDGVTEAFDPRGQMFGRERLGAMFSDCQTLAVAEAVRRIDAEVSSHRGGNPPADDATLAMIEFAGQVIPTPRGCFGLQRVEPVGDQVNKVSESSRN